MSAVKIRLERNHIKDCVDVTVDNKYCGSLEVYDGHVFLAAANLQEILERLIDNMDLENTEIETV